jgi:glycyl-tRNA synthetase beta subunit
MRDELNEALKRLDQVAYQNERGTDLREHVDRARSQIVSALLLVLKSEAADLREYLAETSEDP